MAKAVPFFTLSSSPSLKCHQDLHFDFHGRKRLIDSYYLCINDAPAVDSDDDGSSALLGLGGGQQPSSTLLTDAATSGASSNASASAATSTSLPACFLAASSELLSLLRLWQRSVAQLSLDGRAVYLPFEVSDEHVGCLRVDPGGTNLKVTVGSVDVPGCELNLATLEEEFVHRSFGGGEDGGDDELDFEPMETSMLDGQEAICWVTRNELMDEIDDSIKAIEAAIHGSPASVSAGK